MSDQPSILPTKQARLRVLEQQATEFGNLCPPHIITEIDQLRREIADLDGSATRAGLPRPPQPDFAHPYPIQSGFTGRVAERTMLTGWQIPLHYDVDDFEADLATLRAMGRL